MSDQGQWFKLWCSSLVDNDLDNLDICDFGRWAKLGAFIKQHGQEGEVTIQAPARALCSMLQVPDFDALHAAVSCLPNVIVRRAKMEQADETTLTVSFRNWPKYQGDYSTNRVRKFREMKRSRGEEKRREEKRGEERRILLPEHQQSSAPVKEKIWPPEDHWLKTFVDTQTFVPAPHEAFNDPKWWENVSETTNGINLPFLNQEFAKMGAWLIENKSRLPVKPSGWKKFTRGWLERAADRERRMSNGHQRTWQ